MTLVLGKSLYYRPGSQIFDLTKSVRSCILRYCSTSENENELPKTGKRKFRTLVLYPRKAAPVRRTRSINPIEYPPRTKRMRPNMDWANIWPGPKTFHPASVPLPIRQGDNPYGAPLHKYANTELMKIPNFLHLTPPAIEKHCKAIKRFCTEWPKGLETDEDIEKHFPVEIISSDYCHSSCSIRDPNARIISLKIKLKNLEFDKHAKDKFLRLVGPRYDPSTDYVTITTKSCPIKKQNYEYAHYLITALYFESWKIEEWEKLKSDEDMEEYIFSERKGFQTVDSVLGYNKRKSDDVGDFGKAMENWLNKGDDPNLINEYKAAAMKLLSVPPLNA